MKNRNYFDELFQSSAVVKVALMAVVMIWTIVLVMLVGGTSLLLERPSQALQTTPDAFTSPAISLNPALASAGSSVTVNGQGWPAGAKVLIYLADTAATPYALSSATVDSAGRFAADFIFPSDPRWQNKGLIQVLAQTADNGAAAQAVLTVIPTPEPDTALPTALPTQTATLVALEPSATATPVLVPTTPIPVSTPFLTTNTDLNIRSGPGTNYPVLGVLRSGQTTEITGLSLNRGWWQITFAGTPEGRGWVSGRYVTAQNTANIPLVQASNPPIPTSTATPVPTATPTSVVIADDNDNDDNDNDDNDNDNDDEDYDDWKGEYYSDRYLDDREFTRNDEDLDFDWDDGSPGDLPNDNFSVRWSRWYNFSAGRYRFEARADDGIRVYVDGQRVIDEWHSSDADDLYTVELNLTGLHWLVVEYYERNGEARVEVDARHMGDIVTPTPTSTATPTWTPTPTVTPTNTPTGEPTATSTSTAIPTGEPTATSTSTAIPTEEPTATPIPTNTPTEEPTATSTSTAIPTEEPTATPIPTNTPTEEPTATPTNTPTDTPEPSPTLTVLPTLTGTITTTLTLTPTSLLGTS